MKKEFILLLVSGWLIRFPGAIGWHQTIKNRIHVKHRSHISFQRICVGLKGITVFGLRFSNERHGVELQFASLHVVLTLHLAKLSFKEMVAKGFALRIDRTSGSNRTDTPLDSAAPGIHGKIAKMWGKGGQLLGPFVKWAPSTLRFEDASVSVGIGENLSGSFSCSNFTIKKFQQHDAGIIRADCFNADFSCRNRHQEVMAVAMTDVLHVNIDYKRRDAINFKLLVNTNGIRFQSPFIVAGKEMYISPASLQLTGEFDRNRLLVDESSFLHFNRLNFSFSVDCQLKDTGFFALYLKLHYCTMADFLFSFPHFVNSGIYSVLFTGGLGFNAAFKMRMDEPEEGEFHFRADEDVSVKNWGDMDLDFLKTPFVHSIYDNGLLVRKIAISPDDSLFTAVNDISPYLTKLVICSEDSDFYEHHGVSIEALGCAIRQNIARRKFVSGASTITMQLVKNLFLHQRKDLYRKVEEVLLSWILTDIVKLDKHRQLEIYLNIIEFGKGIYGITDASRYYFAKEPADLTLTESLVITYIIPRPQFFQDALLRKTQQLVLNLRAYLERISIRLLNSRAINFDEFIGIQYKIVFASSLGTLLLPRKIDTLHHKLKETYLKALKLWIKRYKGKTYPFISCTYPSACNGPLYAHQNLPVDYCQPGEGQTDVNSNVAFDIEFRSLYGQNRNDALFYQFADLVRETDTESRICWGGDVAARKNLCHFALMTEHPQQ